MSSLELKVTKVTKRFQEFYGKTTEQMPLLIAEGRVPLSAADLMRRRIETSSGFLNAERDAWWLNYFDTGDLVAYHPDGQFKVVPNAQLIRGLNPQTPLSNGAVALGSDQATSIEAYKKLEGFEFERTGLEKYLGKRLTAEEAKNHPVWRALAGNDQSLLDEYVSMAFKEGKRRFNKNSMMCVYLASPQPQVVGHSWCFYSINCGGGSGAGGSGDIASDDGRLVGMR